MAKHSHIFKASKLIEEYPELGSNIACEDFIHVFIKHDNFRSLWTVISYIWDTRKIVSYVEVHDGTDIAYVLNNVEELSEVSWEYMQELDIFADDNLQQLQFVTNMSSEQEDLLESINHEVFTAKRHLKIRVETSEYRNSVLRRYFIDDKCIVKTETGFDQFCRIDKDGTPSRLREVTKRTYDTCWYCQALREIFGWHSSNWFDRHGFKDSYPDLTWGYQGSCISAKNIKAKLAENFNIC